MQALGAGAHPEHVAELAKAAPGEPVAAREPHVLGLEPAAQLAHPHAIARIALVVAAVPLEHALVRGAVDVVDGDARAAAARR